MVFKIAHFAFNKINAILALRDLLYPMMELLAIQFVI